MRRPRFTLRWMMVAVAVVALMIGGLRGYARLNRLSEEYRLRTIFMARRGEPYRRNLNLSQAEWEVRYREIQRANEGAWFKIGPGPSPDKCRKLAPYYASLRRKYERAARYPWLPVAPDPPMPE